MAESAPGDPVWIYLPYVDDRATGMQRYAAQMVLALQRAGLNFKLIIGECAGHPAWLDRVPHSIALPIRLTARLPRPVAALARLMWVQHRLPRAAARNGISTLLALGHEAVAAPRLRQIAVVHDLTHLKDFAGHTRLQDRIRDAWWKRALARSRAVITISEATRRDLLELLPLDPARVHVIHEGYDPALFKPDDRPSDTPSFLLYAGTLEPHKNVALLLEVLALLRGAGRDVSLTLAGRYRLEQVEALLIKAPLEVRAAIHFAGFVTDAALAELMAGCAAFVFPSRNEGFGLAPVEAMACGAPVIAAAAGSLPEVIAHGGLLLSPDDPQTWATEIEGLLADDKVRDDLVGRALARSRAFSWDDAARDYMRLLA